MIREPDELIYIIDEDTGGRMIFSAEELKSTLAECFALSNLGMDSYLAEDLALAVEYDLYRRTRNEEERVLASKEVNLLIFRLLGELNLDDVGNAFRCRRGVSSILLLPEKVRVERCIKGILDLAEPERKLLAGRVIESLDYLKLKTVPDKLIELLALGFEGKAVPDHLPVDAFDSGGDFEEYHATPGEILAGCGTLARALAAEKIIGILGVKKHAPSVGVVFYMEQFAGHARLESPLMELELFGKLEILRNALAEVLEAAKSMEQTHGRLPKFLYFAGMEKFFQKYFNLKLRRGSKLAQELIGELTRGSDESFNVVLK